MAVTVDRTIGNYHDSSNARIRKIGRAVGPASYTAGGEPLAAPELGLGKVEVVLFEPLSDGTNVHLAVYNVAAGTLSVYDPTTGAEVANGTDLSAFAARFEAIGY
jgi:hypothetical protein